MNIAIKATILAAKTGRTLALASLMCLVRTDGVAAESVIADAAIAPHGRTERVSVDSAGRQANNNSSDPAISATGRFIAFTSSADNLVPGLQHHPGPPAGLGSGDIFVHNRLTGVTELVSINSAGQQGNHNSITPALSADGRFVAFLSYADNLVPGDTNDDVDVFVHDRTTGVTERVSVDSAGTQVTGNACCLPPAISANGRFVAFASDADNLVAGDTNGVINPYTGRDIFVHDRTTKATTRVSIDSAGRQANNNSSYAAALSADGRFVAFASDADNLVAGDTNNSADIFVHDRLTGVTQRVSVDSAGHQANNGSGSPALSADGRFVAFASDADNLVAGDTNATLDTFVHDRKTGVTQRVSVDSVGRQANNHSIYAALSADGRFVAFLSYADNLVAGDTNATWDTFVHDRKTGVTQGVSVDSAGRQANNRSFQPALSADGRFVAFASDADNLVAGDTNGVINPYLGEDIFVHGVSSRNGKNCTLTNLRP